MKNIQVIDGALNCTFGFFQATDEEFDLIFPEPRQDIKYPEDLMASAKRNEINVALKSNLATTRPKAGRAGSSREAIL
jgi:hypothetical protein